jgi:uncharacterized protein (DUF433 family)
MATAASWVMKTPNVCGGDACIRKTRITVWGLVEYRKLGLPDGEILRRLPDLTTADLEAAWDYYQRNLEEIERALWENEAVMIEHDGKDVPTWFLVRGRRLGLSDEHIRESFEPPLSQSVLDAAWAKLRERPEEIEKALREHAGA